MIGGLHDEHLGILLGSCEEGVEGGLEAWGVGGVALHVGYVGPEHQHSQLCRRLGMEEERVAHRVVESVLPAILVVVHHGELQAGDGGLLPAHFVVDLERLDGVARLHVEVADHDAQVHVVGCVGAECLQLHECRVELPFLLVEPELLDAHLRTGTFEQLDAAEGADGFVGGAHRAVELHQLQEDVAAAGLEGCHLLEDRYGSLCIPFVEVESGERLEVIRIVGVVLASPPYVGRAEAVGVQVEMEQADIIECLGRLGIDVEAMAIEVHGGRIVFLQAAFLSLQVEVVESALSPDSKGSERQGEYDKKFSQGDAENPRVRRWQSPRAALVISACGVGNPRTRRLFCPAVAKSASPAFGF